jgi:hypothetical protein
MNESAMNIVFLGILVAAAALLVIFLIPALVEIKRTARSASLTLDAIRTEIRPAMETLQGTLREYRELGSRANQDFLKVEQVIDQARRVMDLAGKLLGMTTVLGKVSGIASLARAGQKGAEAFLDRLRKSPRR